MENAVNGPWLCSPLTTDWMLDADPAWLLHRQVLRPHGHTLVPFCLPLIRRSGCWWWSRRALNRNNIAPPESSSVARRCTCPISAPRWDKSPWAGLIPSKGVLVVVVEEQGSEPSSTGTREDLAAKDLLCNGLPWTTSERWEEGGGEQEALSGKRVKKWNAKLFNFFCQMWAY